MFIVSFERKDKKPPEKYYYPTVEDALFHFNLFRNDDSDLYTTISLIEEINREHKVLNILRF